MSKDALYSLAELLIILSPLLMYGFGYWSIEMSMLLLITFVAISVNSIKYEVQRDKSKDEA